MQATGLVVASTAKVVGCPRKIQINLHGEKNDGSFPVGGHHCEFAQCWGKLTQDSFVIRTILDDYSLEFTGSAPIRDTLAPVCPPRTNEKRIAWKWGVDSMFDNRAIRMLTALGRVPKTWPLHSLVHVYKIFRCMVPHSETEMLEKVLHVKVVVDALQVGEYTT